MPLARPLTRCALLAAAALLVPAAGAAADAPLAAVDADTPVSAQGGWVAFSQHSADGYHLMLAKAGTTRDAGVAPARRPFDVTLGLDTKGRVVATYSRCDAAGRACDAYRLPVQAGGGEQRLALSSRTASERFPAQWRGTFAFVRTGACDVPYVRTGGRTRALDRGHCATVTGQALRGSTIIQTATTKAARDAPTQSEVRRLSTAGGPSKLLAKQAFGEESNLFAGPSILGQYAYVTRVGVHPTPSFVRIAVRTGARTEVAAGTSLIGPAARDGGRTAYLEGEGTFRGGECGVQAPCRVVVADQDPFGAAERTLAPQLRLDLPAAAVPADQDLALGGTLTAPVVQRGKTLRATPVAGTTVELTTAPFTTTPDQAAPQPTGRTAVTGPDGRFSIALPAPLAPLQYVGATTHDAVPAATRSDNLNSAASIGLAVSATTVPVGGSVTFTGPLGPAQPGREILVQRRTSHDCDTSTTGQQICRDEWETVGAATLAADGRSYSATLALQRSGVYTAVLPFVKLDQPNGPTSYSGRSAPVEITVA